MKRNDGGPAFPQLSIDSGQRDGHGDLTDPFTSASGGMTVRDWHAGNSSIGLDTAIALWQGADRTRWPNWADAGDRAAIWTILANLRLEYADAMIAARDAGL